MVRNVPALAGQAQAVLSSHPGFMAGVLVPASHGEELSAFQVCTKPSNLSSHGGVIKAVPTKQNELNRFPRPGESVLGSGKILSPLHWSRSCQRCAQLCLAQHGSMPHAPPLLYRRAKSWEMLWQGLAPRWCAPCCLISLCSGEEHRAALMLERSSVPGDRQASPPPPDIFSSQI